MKRSTLIITAIAMLATAHNGKLDAQTPQGGSSGQNAPVQGGEPVASFRSGVDLVRVSAVVRDRKGRFPIQRIREEVFFRIVYLLPGDLLPCVRGHSTH